MFPEYKTLPDAPAAEPEPPGGFEWYGTRPGVADSDPALSGPTPDRHRLYLERAPLKTRGHYSLGALQNPPAMRICSQYAPQAGPEPGQWT